MSKAINRRELLKLSGAAAISTLPQVQATPSHAAPAPRKRVIVAGGGIGGLCCAFELMERGHDVTVLEASGRPGGHVKTIHDPFPDGLYADVGAEHFTRPGYEQYWKYVEKFQLPFLAYPRRINMLRRIGGQWYTEEQLQDPAVLNRFGFNRREIEFITSHNWTELVLLYLGPYLDAFHDEYQPFGVGLDELDQITAGELLAKDGASDAGLRFCGVRRGGGTPAARVGETSALFRVWQQAIIAHRKLPAFKREVFRLAGGNQLLTDTFAARLGDRLRLGAPLTKIEHGDSGVTVHCEQFGEPHKLEAEYLVSCIPMGILKKISIAPAWPEAKQFVLDNVKFGSQSRVLLQSRTPFWKADLPSINLETADSAMYLVYQTADEVPTDRAMLMGSGRPDVTAEDALAAFGKFYPGKARPTIERAFVHNWSQHPWAPFCERHPFLLGELKRYWPQIMEPVGRIHFAGCGVDNLPWGMDAATRSANRVAELIHRL